MTSTASGALYLFADRLPPNIGGMETHAAHFRSYFGSDSEYRLASTFTSAEECDVRKAVQEIARSATEKQRLRSPLTPEAKDRPKPPILFFNSGRWIEHLRDIRNALPDAILFQRTGGNDAIKADLGSMDHPLHLRQQFWADAINSHLTSIVSNSRFTTARLKAIGVREDRILLVSGGVDVDACKAACLSRTRLRRTFFGKHADMPCVVCVSRFLPFKGIDTAIEAFNYASRNSALALFVVGSGPLERDLVALAGQSRFAHNISFMGTLTHDQSLRVVAAADAVMCLSRDWVRTVPGGVYTHTETMGRVACEALANGTPVIASRVGGLPEVLGNSPHLVPPNAPSHAGAALLSALASGRLTTAAVEQARASFSWRSVFTQYKDAWTRHAA